MGELIKNGGNALAIECFKDHPGQPLEAPKDQDRKKKGGGKTVSAYFKGQLDDLMTTLYKTEPHFIRCVVPNTHKIPGGVESDLVMHQYKCNGVLAGIAICRMGFPNKTLYPEFKARYNIIAAQAVAKAKNDKAAAQVVMDVVKMDKEKYRLGHTKVFFRAGIAGKMEEFREDKIGNVLAWLQSGARGKASRMAFKKLQDQKMALYACQRAIRTMMIAKTWLWMQIWLAIKPNLKCTQFGKFKKEYEDKIELAEANIGQALEARSKVQAVYDGLMGQQIDSLNANKVKSEKDKSGLELDLRDARLDLEDAVKGKAELDKQGKLLQAAIVDSNTRLDEMARALNEAESTKKRLQVENQDLNRQIEELENAIANMNKAKISVTTQLGDTKALADAEAKDRAALLTKYKMMSTDLENLREKLENEAMRKSD